MVVKIIKPMFKSSSETKFISLPSGSEENLAAQNSTSNKMTKVCFILIVTFVFAGSVIYYVAGSFQPQQLHFVADRLTNEHTSTVLPKAPIQQCQDIPDSHKFDCFPRGKADQESCTKRGCCWTPRSQNDNVPWCYYTADHRSYKVVNTTIFKRGKRLLLNLTSNSFYPNDIKVLLVKIDFDTKNRLHVKVCTLLNLYVTKIYYETFVKF